LIIVAVDRAGSRQYGAVTRYGDSLRRKLQANALATYCVAWHLGAII
jgi:hypothetical protein